MLIVCMFILCLKQRWCHKIFVIISGTLTTRRSNTKISLRPFPAYASQRPRKVYQKYQTFSKVQSSLGLDPAVSRFFPSVLDYASWRYLMVPFRSVMFKFLLMQRTRTWRYSIELAYLAVDYIGLCSIYTIAMLMMALDMIRNYY